MVLSDRFGGKQPPGLAKKIALYVAGFGLGTLLLSVVLGLAATLVAESALSEPSGAPSAAAAPAAAGKAPRPPAPRAKPPSKAPRPRGNESAESEGRDL
jgi:cell division septation protein DedD